MVLVSRPSLSIRTAVLLTHRLFKTENHTGCNSYSTRNLCNILTCLKATNRFSTIIITLMILSSNLPIASLIYTTELHWNVPLPCLTVYRCNGLLTDYCWVLLIRALDSHCCLSPRSRLFSSAIYWSFRADTQPRKNINSSCSLTICKQCIINPTLW